MSLVLLFSGTFWSSGAVAQWEQARTLFWLDLSFGVFALVLVFFRRRWPFAIAALTSALGAVSVTANGPAALASVSLATRRVTWQILVIGVMSIVPSVSIPMLAPNRADNPLWIDFGLGILASVAMLLGGMYIGSRRELLWTLRDRAKRAEAEQALRVEQGQLTERARIAREMHDVLAHRISLIAMHAGALAYRTDLTSEQVRATAELLQTKAHEALTDLRQVLGVLRDDEAATASQHPQPTFTDLSTLVLEAEDAGMRIQYDDRVIGSAQMPAQIGRTTYRIVQEGLTNVRKHAPGVTALVRVTGSPTDGVSIRISNPARSLTPAPLSATLPRSGLGLVGLTERAMLAGGRLTTRREAGAFELESWLPWK